MFSQRLELLHKECQERGKWAWAIAIDISHDRWESIDSIIENVHSKQEVLSSEMAELILKSAVDQFKFDIDSLSKYTFCIDLCKDENILEQIMQTVLNRGVSSDMLKKMWDRVDLKKIFGDSPFHFSLGSDVIREIFQAGVGTFLDNNSYQKNSFMLRTLEQLDENLVVLGYVSGFVSSKDISDFVTKTVSQIKSAENGRFESMINRLVESPLSLKDRCRQVISHSLGVYPGRQSRIEALAIPPSLKMFLQYSEFDETPIFMEVDED